MSKFCLKAVGIVSIWCLRTDSDVSPFFPSLPISLPLNLSHNHYFSLPASLSCLFFSSLRSPTSPLPNPSFVPYLSTSLPSVSSLSPLPLPFFPSLSRLSFYPLPSPLPLPLSLLHYRLWTLLDAASTAHTWQTGTSINNYGIIPRKLMSSFYCTGGISPPSEDVMSHN